MKHDQDDAPDPRRASPSPVAPRAAVPALLLCGPALAADRDRGQAARQSRCWDALAPRTTVHAGSDAAAPARTQPDRPAITRRRGATRHRSVAALLAAGLLSGLAGAGSAAASNIPEPGSTARSAPAAVAADRAAAGDSRVIVQAQRDSVSLAREAVRRLGGTVERELELVNGFSATVPPAALPALRRAAGVKAVTANRPVEYHGAGTSSKTTTTTYDPKTDVGSMLNTTTLTGAREYWKAGFTGKGVDIAMIDSGVAPVNGMTVTGKIVNGPDLSFESQDADTTYLDSFGHGTHMAGVMAGRDNAASAKSYATDTTNFLGMAPDSRVLSLKLADAYGATDVSQMIAAIDWVVQHKNDNGMNIRVLNLSFGTLGQANAMDDPLAYAAEIAWHNGIVVVVAAGNSRAESNELTNPAINPYVVSVGAADTMGTLSTADDTVASFSSQGYYRHPDLVAPGKSLQSLRVPQSGIDQQYPGGRIDSRFFRGSGTSQAAAITSGAVALILQQRPTATPDQIKALLRATATPLTGPAASRQGKGELNLKAALTAPLPSNATQTHQRAIGVGSLENARGKSERLEIDGIQLTSEHDIFGMYYDASTMPALTAQKATWTGGSWNGSDWTGTAWTGTSWAGTSWAGRSWAGRSWAGRSWAGMDWTGRSWANGAWTGGAWTTNNLTSSTWTGRSWAGGGWD